MNRRFAGVATAGITSLLLMVSLGTGGCNAILGINELEGGDAAASPDGPTETDVTEPIDAASRGGEDAHQSPTSPASDSSTDGQAEATPGPDDAESGASIPAADQFVSCDQFSCAAGCCGLDGQCHTDEGSSTCGSGGGSCSTCTGAQTCTGGSCVDKCTSANCATGCCDSSGNCVTTLSDGQCGTQGAACGACTGNNHCTQGQCGCAASTDCPLYQACNLSTHVCSNSCSTSATCNTGCCNSTTGQCASGTAGAACGTNSGKCSICTGASVGSACESTGSCGCNGPGDCPTGTACNTSTHQCAASCAGGFVCEGACCDGTTCQAAKATRCSGATQQACSTAGQWVNGAVTAGTCGAVCTPGSSAAKCSGLVPETCGTDGQWEDGKACPYLCTAGACTGVCSPGSTQCCGTTSNVLNPTPTTSCAYGTIGPNSNGLTTFTQTCDMTGAWTMGQQCSSCGTGLGGSVDACCIYTGVAVCELSDGNGNCQCISL